MGAAEIMGRRPERIGLWPIGAGERKADGPIGRWREADGRVGQREEAEWRERGPMDQAEMGRAAARPKWPVVAARRGRRARAIDRSHMGPGTAYVASTSAKEEEEKKGGGSPGVNGSRAPDGEWRAPVRDSEPAGWTASGGAGGARGHRGKRALGSDRSGARRR